MQYWIVDISWLRYVKVLLQGGFKTDPEKVELNGWTVFFHIVLD